MLPIKKKKKKFKKKKKICSQWDFYSLYFSYLKNFFKKGKDSNLHQGGGAGGTGGRGWWQLRRRWRCGGLVEVISALSPV